MEFKFNGIDSEDLKIIPVKPLFKLFKTYMKKNGKIVDVDYQINKFIIENQIKILSYKLTTVLDTKYDNDLIDIVLVEYI